MKNIIKKIRYWCAWLFSAKVLEAINAGAKYEEVEALVLEMIGEKEKGSAPAKETLPTSKN